MRTRALLGGLIAAALALFVASPAAAIRYGEPDNNEHPFVGLMVANDEDGTPLWRCSGTLVSPTVFLTAGHCTSAPAASATIWFEEDMQTLREKEETSYPFPDDLSYSGRTYAHPDYDDNAFYLNDLGVVVLDEGVTGLDAYGEIPEEGYFDQFFVKRGQNPQLFTAVGYGLQRNMPDQTALTSAELVRLQATLQIINEDAAFGEKKAGNSVLFTNSAAGGGTCNGDSGGPIFVEGGNVVAAVTSYGLNARCAGTGGGYRVDTADDLAWLATFGIGPGRNW